MDNLSLNDTQVTDTGLAYFKDCKNLQWLGLTGTRVSDTGLAPFKDCKALTHLKLQKTKVTPAMVEEFKKALPRCKIEWDGGVIEPRASADPDRRAAEYVLSVGGMVWVNGQDRAIKAVADLPGEAFRLTTCLLYLSGPKVSDAGLAHFKNCKGLAILNLAGTQVSDLSPLKGMKLTVLNCNSTRVSDLSPLQGMPLRNFIATSSPNVTPRSSAPSRRWRQSTANRRPSSGKTSRRRSRGRDRGGIASGHPYLH